MGPATTGKLCIVARQFSGDEFFKFRRVIDFFHGQDVNIEFADDALEFNFVGADVVALVVVEVPDIVGADGKGLGRDGGGEKD